MFKNFITPLLLGAVGLFSAASANAQSVCDSFYSQTYTLPQGKLTTSMPSLSRPAKGVKVKEPSFGTCLVRATDHVAENLSKFSRTFYARRQAFNANNTYYITFSADGWWHLYDATTLKYLRKLSPRVVNSSVAQAYHISSDSEMQWHPTDPNSAYYLSSKGGTKLMKLDVRNNSYQVVADFAGKLPSWASTATKMWTRNEGSPSKDARYWGFQVENGTTILGYFVWDLQLNKLVGSMQSSKRADHTSMSPSGRWIVLADEVNGTWAYSPDFKQKKKILHESEHSDLAIGANGHDYYVGADYDTSKGDVYMADLDTCPAVPASATTASNCPRTVLFQLYMDGASSALHISGKAYDRPGWVVVSTYGSKNSRDGSTPWYANKVFAMEMKANPRIYPISYTRRTTASTGSSYWAEPHATTNRNMTRISFNSNWGGTSYEDIDTYVVKLPVTAMPGSTTTVVTTSRLTGGNYRPGKDTDGALTSGMKPMTTTSSTIVPDASVSTTTTEPAAWTSPGMRIVRNAASAVRGTNLYIPRAAIWSLPSVAWLRSVFADEEPLDERDFR